MNRNVALFVGATIGAGAGYFVSAVIADYIEEKEIRDQAPVVVDEDDGDELTDDEDESSPDKNGMRKKKKDSRPKTNYTNFFNSIDRPDLAALAQRYKDGDGPSDNTIIPATLLDEDEIETPDVSKPEPTGITIISQEEFNNNPDEFEVVDLTYYADDIVVGEDDNIIPGPEDIIGIDALVSFGLLSGDPDIVYVRNTQTRALYEIVRMSTKYAIDADADIIKPRKGLKKKIDFDEVTDDENDTEAAS
jgi:hypothetical protein